MADEVAALRDEVASLKAQVSVRCQILRGCGPVWCSIALISLHRNFIGSILITS